MALGLFAAGLVLLLFASREKPKSPAREREPPAAPAPVPGPEPTSPPPERTAPPARPSAAPASTDTAFIVGPRPDDPHPEGALPHPITPEHERLRYENQLIQGLNDAMDLRDAPRLRELVELYRKAEPDDVHKLQAGYTIVADCIEHPGAESRAAAEHYWQTEKASILRRYVRRHCLGSPPGSR